MNEFVNIYVPRCTIIVAHPTNRRRYTGPHPSKGGIQGVKCVDRWELPEDTYPGGLDVLRKEYGAPFLLYGPYFCTENQWNQTLVPAHSDAGVPFGRDASEAFYTEVFLYGQKHGGFAYEVCT